MINEHFEHSPAVRPRLVEAVPRIGDDWLARFNDIPTPDIADHVGLHYTMDSSIGPLHGSCGRIAGRAVTVKAWPGDGLAVYGGVGMAEPGDILVIDARGESLVSRGGFHLMAVPRERGLRGVIVDGAIRDVGELGASGFPVFGRARAAHASGKRWPGEINTPCCCGGVVVHAGDLVVADEDGVVVVPRKSIESVWAAIESARPPASGDEHIAKHEARVARHREVFERAGGVAESWREDRS